MTERLKKVWISLIVAFSMALTCALCINLSPLTAKAQSGFEIDYVPIESVDAGKELAEENACRIEHAIRPNYLKSLKITIKSVSGC